MRTVHAALDAGLRLLDTAVNYGSKRGRTGYSEALVARALAPWSGDPDDVVVVCKGGNLRTDEQTFVQDASRHQQRRTSAARRGADGRRHRGGREPALTVVARRAARPPAVRGLGHRVPLLEPPGRQRTGRRPRAGAPGVRRGRPRARGLPTPGRAGLGPGSIAGRAAPPGGAPTRDDPRQRRGGTDTAHRRRAQPAARRPHDLIGGTTVRRLGERVGGALTVLAHRWHRGGEQPASVGLAPSGLDHRHGNRPGIHAGLQPGDGGRSAAICSAAGAGGS